MTDIATFGPLIDVNTVEAGEQTQANITALSDGGFVVVWLDTPSSGDALIRSQIYDASGSVLGNNAAVTTGPTLNQPMVTSLSDGGYVIVWTIEDSNTSTDEMIMAQRFDASGGAAGAAFEIDTPKQGIGLGVTLHGVTALDNGDFALNWEQFDRQPNDAPFWDDYYQVIDSNNQGVLPTALRYNIGSPIDLTGTFANDIVSLGGGNFAIAWMQIDEFSTHQPQLRIFDSLGQEIFARSYEQDLGFGGSPYELDIKIEALSNGNLAVTWLTDQNTFSTGSMTEIAIYAPDGTVVMADTVLSTLDGDTIEVIALDGSYIVKLSSQSTATEYSNDGAVVATDIVLPDDFLTSVTDFDGLSASVIAGTDSDGAGVDLQFFTSEAASATTLAPFGPLIDVNTSEIGEQTGPDIAVLEDGNFAVVWLDSNDGDGSFSQRDGYSIKLQVYDPAGTAIGGEVDVSGMSASRSSPHVTGLSDGSMIIVWSQVNPDSQSGTLLMVQKLSATGQAIGGAYEIDTNISDTSSGVSVHDVVALDNGNYAIHWESYDNFNGEDYFQIIDSSGMPVLSSPRLYVGSNDFSDPGFSNQMVALGNGGFALAWMAGNEFGSPNAQMQLYDADGVSVLNRNFPYGIDSFEPTSAAIKIEALSNGNVAVTWNILDFSGNDEYSTQIAIYAPDGTLVLSDTVLTTEQNSNAEIVALDGSFVLKLSTEDTATVYDNDGTLISTGLALPDGFINAVSSFGGLVATVTTGTDSDGSGIDLQFFTTTEGEVSGTDDGETLTGTDGNDVIAGRGGDDTLIGLGGDDILSGGTGADTLNGGDGNDTLVMGQGGPTGEGDTASGGSGDDSFQISSLNPASLHTISGGDGSDTIDISTYLGNAQFTVDLGAQMWTYTGTSQNVVGSFGGIENFISGNQDDVITGDASDNILSGRGGADSLFGGAGNDTLIGGTGIDSFDGGSGIDTLDYADFGIGITIRMDQGRALIGPSQVAENFISIERFVLGSAADNFIGDAGDDTVEGGAGNDQLRGNGGADTLSGGEGDDIIYFDHLDTVIGGAGYDRAFSVQGTQNLTIDLGASGLEYVSGGSFIDTLDAASATQSVKLFGNFGDDQLTGSAFDDYVSGGQGSDTINGGDGADIIDGSLGADSLYGGGGDDIFYFDSDDTIIEGGAGYDRIYLRGYSEGANVVVGSATGIEFAAGNNGDDIFDASGSTIAVKLLGGAGNDTLTGGDIADQLYGFTGDDILNGGGGNDILNAAQGADTLDGGAGDDIIYVDSDDISVTGGDGYDRVYANGYSGAISLDMTTSGVEYASGSAQGDNFTADGSAVAVKLLGRAGDDTLIGGDQNDLIYGGLGDDMVTGGAGDDFLSGGAGTDTFFFSANWGDDKVNDFTDGTDLLDMTALSITFADLMISVDAFGNAVVNYNGQSITLLGMQAADVDAGVFSF